MEYLSKDDIRKALSARYAEEAAEQNEVQARTMVSQLSGSAIDKYATECRECAAEHRQLAEWLRELKDLREENKVLTTECDRLIKEKGELLQKVSGGDVLKICQLEDQLKDFKEEYTILSKISKGFWDDLQEAKRLLKAAVEDINFYVDCYEAHCDECCCSQDNHCHWKHEAEALKLIGDEENGTQRSDDNS